MDTSSANTEPATGPFSGLLVIDLTHVLNGPFGTTLLTDLGARVVKIEPPGHGDDTRTYGPFYKDQSLYFSFVNRGKESIVLNLKEGADRTIFLNMVRQADVGLGAQMQALGDGSKRVYLFHHPGAGLGSDVSGAWQARVDQGPNL
jgi:crotonobetainyl-CoA:carnitine CoA-transferase CaiB-like acyl-CoA transferase